MNELLEPLPLQIKQVIYLILAALTFVYGCYVIWHWDFRVIRPIIRGVSEWGWKWLFFGKADNNE